MQEVIKEILKHIESPLSKPDGTKITTKEEWEQQRQVIKKLLQECVYGPMPEMPDQITVLSEKPDLLRYDGKAIEKFYMLTADKIYPEFKFGLRILRPNTTQNVPVLFMVLCDSSAEGYTYEYAEEIILNHHFAIAMVDRIPATPEIPNSDVRLWTEDSLRHDEFLYYEIYKTRDLQYPNRTLPLDEYMAQYPHVHQYGKIAVGAHCVRVAISFVLNLGFADPDRLAVTGHSRDGKVSLCAGVFDERLSVVLPHGSGCGGTGLYKVPAKGMERIDDMVRMWPSWLPGLARFRDGHEDAMPLDMHFARACIAPRGIMDAEGLADFWAGPFSSYVGKWASQEVFDLLGTSDRNGIFIRNGIHEMNLDDIRHSLSFCEHIFYGKKTDYDFSDITYPIQN